MSRILRPPHVPSKIRLNAGSLSLGHAVSPPTCNALALFGPPKFTAQQQAANPEAPMTRVIKDVLRVGNWNIGGPQTPSMWEVTPEILQAIADSVAIQQASGHSINVGLSHGNESLLVPTDELVTPVDQVALCDGVLWMACYMTPTDSLKYRNPAFKVSPGMQWGYVDGSGFRHQLALVHVAITDRPIVAGQGPFLAMANASQSSKTKGKSMDFAGLVEAINAILQAGGLGALADDVNETNLVERLKGMAEVIKAMKGIDDTDPGDGAGDTGAGAAGDAAGAAGGVAMNNIGRLIQQAVSAAVKPMQSQMVAMSNEIRTFKAGAAKNAKEAFKAEMARLGGAGVSAAVLQEKVAMAESSGNWDVRLLNGLQPSITMNNAAKGGASANPPPQGAKDDAKPEDRAAIVKRVAERHGVSIEKAEKLVP